MNASILLKSKLPMIVKTIKLFAICPLAMSVQGRCHHVFEVIIKTFYERAYGDLVLLNFWYDSGI